MRVEVITTYFREEFLAPLFFLHYSWVDNIHVITQAFPDGKFNDHLKRDLINAVIAESKADWVICVDFDEFVFPYPYGTDLREALANEQGDKIQVPMWRVWRHRTDSDIDRMKPPVPQRLHGIPNLEHTKPCIFKPYAFGEIGPDGFYGQEVKIGIGCHDASFPKSYQWGKPWTAVHWANADPCFGIDRSRRDRQERICQRQLNENLGVIPEWLQPGFLERKYKDHENDPLIDIGINHEQRT